MPESFKSLSTLPAADRFAPPVLTPDPEGWFWIYCQIRPGKRIVTFTHKGQGILAWAWCQVHAAILLPDANWWVHKVLCTCTDLLIWISEPCSILPLAILSPGRQSSCRQGGRFLIQFFFFLLRGSQWRERTFWDSYIACVELCYWFSCRLLGQMA